MNNKVLYLVSFVAGAAISGCVTWLYTKKKYEQIAQEEIDSVKAAFRKKEVVADYISKGKTEVLNDMAEIIETKKVQPDHSWQDLYSAEAMANRKPVDKPYVITPEEFGELDDYERISLIYFSNGVLTDDDYELVDDVESCIGRESLNHFGEYEDDSVFVRNDARKCDYEVLMDQRDFDDVMKMNPIRYKDIYKED